MLNWRQYLVCLKRLKIIHYKYHSIVLYIYILYSIIQCNYRCCTNIAQHFTELNSWKCNLEITRRYIGGLCPWYGCQCALYMQQLLAQPCALHTANLRPRPETTVVSLTLRQSSNDWIITTQEIITRMKSMVIKRCPSFLYFQPEWLLENKWYNINRNLNLHVQSNWYPYFFTSDWHQLLEKFFPS